MDNFEKALEADISRLAEEVRSTRELPEMIDASEVQIVKEAMKALPQKPGQPTVQVVTPDPAGMSSVLPAYAKDASPETKFEIEYLVDVAFREGIGKALSQAQESSPYVEDAVRDVLAGKLYPELQKRGIVK